MELMLEFFATMDFSLADKHITDPCLTFRLGGVTRHCTLMEFSARVGIYTHNEVNSCEFITFMTYSLFAPPDDFSASAYWIEVTNPSQAYDAS